jgi:hypothetical protein
MVQIYVWPDDGSLTEPKHVATPGTTLKSVVLNGYCCTIYFDILKHKWMENIKMLTVMFTFKNFFYHTLFLCLQCRISCMFFLRTVVLVEEVLN